jgi:hypothetical protein
LLKKLSCANLLLKKLKNLELASLPGIQPYTGAQQAQTAQGIPAKPARPSAAWSWL